MIRAPGGQIGIEAVAHHGHGIGLTAQDRQLGYHGLGLCQLIFAAVGHGHGRCADAGVKALYQTLLGTGIEVADGCKKGALEYNVRVHAVGKLVQLLRNALSSDALEVVVILRRYQDLYVCLLMGTVGIQESTGNIYDGLAAPLHDQPGLLGDCSHNGGFQIFLTGIAHELVQILGIDDDRHTLLRFCDGQFCAVQTFIFLGDQIQVDVQTVCQFADGYGHAACTEVVALLNKIGYFRPAEETLQLTLCRRVALLNLCAACGQGLLCVGLGGACCAAHAVTSGPAAKKDNDISGIGIQTLYIFTCGCAHNGADLHTLGYVTGMVDLLDLAGSQTDLVAVRRVSLGCVVDQLLLGQLAL